MDSDLNNVFLWKATLDVKSGRDVSEPTVPQSVPSPPSQPSQGDSTPSPVDPIETPSPFENIVDECEKCEACEVNLKDLKEKISACELTTSALDSENKTLNEKIDKIHLSMIETEEISQQVLKLRHNKAKLVSLLKLNEDSPGYDPILVEKLDEENSSIKAYLREKGNGVVNFQDIDSVVADLLKKLRHLKNLEKEVSSEIEIHGYGENYDKVLQLINSMITYKAVTEMGSWRTSLNELVNGETQQSTGNTGSTDVPPFNNPGFENETMDGSSNLLSSMFLWL